jgi:two-component system response regulator NreC
MMKTTSVMLISDEAIPRSGLKHLLTAEPGFKVAGEASSKDALEQSSNFNPNVILVHAAPRSSCAQLIDSLRRAAPQAGIVILGRETHNSYLGLLLAAGALGYVLLQSSPVELFTAIRAASQGHRFIDPNLSDELFNLLARKAAGGTKMLSQREEQVLRILAFGYSTKEVADRLNIGRKSIETYRARIREKLGLRSRADIVRYALAMGILSDKTTDKW